MFAGASMTVARPLAIYDGRDLIGAVIGLGRRYAAVDARGNQLGEFKSIKAAIAAVNTSLPCSSVCDANARRDNGG